MRATSFFQTGLCLTAFAVFVLIAGGIALPSSAAASQFKVIYSFCQKANCADGEAPYAGLVRDMSGNLYGTTDAGGAANSGTVFELTRDAKDSKWTHRVLHSFCKKPSCKDTFASLAPLVIDVAGNLYGMTIAGQNSDSPGIIFKLSPNADRSNWKLTILHHFCTKTGCTDGLVGYTGLSYAGAATGAPYDGTSPLYSVSTLGGVNYGGLVYELKPEPDKGKWSYKVIHSFCTNGNCSDGDGPYGSLIVDAAGNLYGTTWAGGGSGGGTVFKLAPNAHKTKWTESVLYSFCALENCTDGELPYSTVLMDASGSLFGTAAYGGASCGNADGCGVAFKLVKSGGAWRQSVLYQFCSKTNCTDGNEPASSTLMDTTGNLFGTTIYGGGNNIDKSGQGGGTVYRLNTTLSVLHSFCAETNCADGEYPSGDLISDDLGSIFGTTQLGGAHDAGTVYEITP